MLIKQRIFVGLVTLSQHWLLKSFCSTLLFNEPTLNIKQKSAVKRFSILKIKTRIKIILPQFSLLSSYRQP